MQTMKELTEAVKNAKVDALTKYTDNAPKASEHKGAALRVARVKHAADCFGIVAPVGDDATAKNEKGFLAAVSAGFRSNPRVVSHGVSSCRITVESTKGTRSRCTWESVSIRARKED